MTIFTPDDTHIPQGYRGVLRMEANCMFSAKPAVKTLDNHLKLIIQVAEENNVLCCVEYHKRFDPLHTDARDRGDLLGPSPSSTHHDAGSEQAQLGYVWQLGQVNRA